MKNEQNVPGSLECWKELTWHMRLNLFLIENDESCEANMVHNA